MEKRRKPAGWAFGFFFLDCCWDGEEEEVMERAGVTAAEDVLDVME